VPILPWCEDNPAAPFPRFHKTRDYTVALKEFEPRITQGGSAATEGLTPKAFGDGKPSED